MKTILITGAAGGVGSALRRALAGKYALRLSDLRPVKKLAAGEKFMRADITRLADFLRISRGVDAIVHLGGYSVEGPWPLILKANNRGMLQRLRGGAPEQGPALHLPHQQSCRGLLS